MIQYATVGTRDPDRAIAFYEALFAPLGMTKLFDHPRGGRVWQGDGRWFGVLVPADGEQASVGNGSMSGFAMPSRGDVDAFYTRALELGGTCEGKPGLRGGEDAGMYFAYVRDLDGNKLAAFRIGAE